jgi:dihydrolipoamide dehydrogenase
MPWGGRASTAAASQPRRYCNQPISWRETRKAATFGVKVGPVSLDFPAVTKRQKALVKQMVDGIAYLMKKNKIEVVPGTGTLLDAQTVRILEGDRRITADSIVIATGSKPARVPIDGANEPGVMTSDEALAMEQLPGSIVIIGGGVVGLEFAQILVRMGTKVTIMECM